MFHKLNNNMKIILRMLLLVVFIFNWPFSLLVLQAQNNPISKIGSKSLVLQIDSINNKSRDLLFINPLKSLDFANEALKLSSSYERGTAYAYRNIGNIYILTGLFSPGISYLKNAEDIFVRTKDTIGLADCYISYGHMYRGLDDIDKEVEYFEKAYNLYKKRNFPDRQGICAINLAQSFFTAGDFLKSKALVNEAIILNKETDQLQVLSVCYNLYGNLELQEGNEKSAAKYFNEVLELTKMLGLNSHKIATVESLLSLSQISVYPNYPKEQHAFLTQALDFAMQYELLSYIPEIYNRMISYHLDNNQLIEAKKYILELKTKSKEIADRRKQNETSLVNKLIIAYDLEQDYKYLEITNQLQKDSLRNRNIFLIIIIIFTVTIFLFLLYLFRVNKKINIQNKALQQKNELISAQKNEVAKLLLNRDNLFSIIAHDLKSPFNGILGLLNIVSNKYYDYSDEKRLEFIQLSYNSAQKAFNLLSDLLEWARLQNEQYVIEKELLNLKELINENIELYKVNASEKEIIIKNNIKENININIDKNSIYTVVRNILNNAIKFTKKGGFIEFEGKQSNNYFELSIKDNGVGMSQETINKLFRIEESITMSGTNDEKGTGLGLSICNDIVTKNNWQIQIESQLGKGTTFKILIPNE